MTVPAIHLSDVTFRWNSGAPAVLDIPELTVAAGQRVFLHGPSGSGKTTLLNLLAGVAVPQSGSVRILGTDLAAMPGAGRDAFRAARIGFVFQQFNLVPYLGLIDNVTLPCRFSRQRKTAAARDATIEQTAQRLLGHMQLDVDELQTRPVAELSVGQQQRVAAARALIGQPELVIADEPTSSIDADARGAFLDLLFGEIAATNATLLMVSHDRDLADHFDQTISLADINRAAG